MGVGAGASPSCALFLLLTLTMAAPSFGALVPPAQLRMRSSVSAPTGRLDDVAPTSYCPQRSHDYPQLRDSRKRQRWEVSSPHPPPPRSALSILSRCYSWRRGHAPHQASTALYARSKEKSSFVEDELDLDDAVDVVDLGTDIPIQRMERGSNQTEINPTAATVVPSTSTETPADSLELWGIPVQSIILLNLVAVIWGTQHAVIKTVVDDSTTLGLGDGVAKWLESAGIGLGSVANDVGDSSDSSAAYFTLARFGLAALLASPYTPGWRLFANNVKEKLGLVDSDGQQYAQSTAAAGNSTSNAVATDEERDSIRLAYKYGAELGLYMFLGYAFQAIGLETTTASRSGFLLYLNVKFVPFFAYFIFGKRIRPSTWISALVAFGGTALLAFDNANAATAEGGLGVAFNVGDLWSIAAAGASAMFILRMEAASKAVPKSSELNAANLWTVAVLSLLWTTGTSLKGTDVSADTATAMGVAFQHTIQQTVSTITTHPLQLIYLSAVTTALCNFLQSVGQKNVSAERASVIYAMDPVYGAIFANILLGETLGGLGLAGALLIVIAAATNAFLDFGNPGTDAIAAAKENE